jgi:nuclear pore complex protein Nup133
MYRSSDTAAVLPEPAREKIKAGIMETRKKVEEMIDRHGQPFAFALYDVFFERGGVKDLLDFPDDKHGYLTRFLRTRPGMARVSWINDVLIEKDINHAAHSLLRLGLESETRLWSKRVQLSLSKLAFMAQGRRPSSAKTGLFTLEPAAHDAATKRDEDKIGLIDRQLGLMDIQTKLHRQVFKTIAVAIDETAELDLAMQVHGANLPKKHKVVKEIFEEGLEGLINHRALDPMTLVDLLTLITLTEDQAEAIPDRFYLALLAARHGLQGRELDIATRLIWRRCFIRNDWAKINDTNMRGDREVSSRLTETAMFRTCYACHQNGMFC